MPETNETLTAQLKLIGQQLQVASADAEILENNLKNQLAHYIELRDALELDDGKSILAAIHKLKEQNAELRKGLGGSSG